MATIEYITARIEGSQKAIAKLEAKLTRIEKARATNWEVNPYYYHEDDLKWTTRDLAQARETLAKWEAKLVEATEKANSRNVPAILEFLENWKARVTEYYEVGIREYFDMKEKARNLYQAIDHYRYGTPECKEAERAYREHAEKLRGKTNGYFADQEYVDRFGNTRTTRVKVRDGELEYISPYHRERTYEDAMRKLAVDLKKDAEAKYDDIVERANRICGTIVDASGLSVGAKGELNGIVIGDRGNARIETIGAGGYNIQIFHFRTLIHEVK